jgi:argininosuccinate lyase
MKPILNLDELDDFIAREDGPFKERYAIIGEKIGSKN